MNARKERQAWCCLQVKLCDLCLSALYVPWCEKALYKYCSFPFFPFLCGGRPTDSGLLYTWTSLTHDCTISAADLSLPTLSKHDCPMSVVFTMLARHVRLAWASVIPPGAGQLAIF